MYIVSLAGNRQKNLVITLLSPSF